MKRYRLWLIRLILGLIICGGWLWLAKKAGDDPILSLLFYLASGVGAGFLFISTILPWMAQAIGSSIFLPGKKTEDIVPDSASRDEITEKDEPGDDAEE